jgi:hypothetical protein
LIQNSIIYANSTTAGLGPVGPNYYLNLYAAATVNSCCASPQPAGVGNIASAPGFVSGGYQLGGGSPCIDTGTNETWMANATDLAGNPRIANGIVDIGAYEWTVSAPQLTLRSSGKQVVVTWPTNAVGFTLQTATNLVPPAVWSTNSTVPAVVDGQNTVTNSISGKQMFYRLAR